MGNPQQMAALLQNPQMMQLIMQQLQNSNLPPEALQQIANNPQMLVQMMQMMAGRGRGMGGHGGMGMGMGGHGGMGMGGHGPPQQHTVTLNPQEQASVQNLMALAPRRIPQQQAVVAFIACDRNEESAANYLLDELYNN